MTKLYCMTYGIIVTWLPAIWEQIGKVADRVFWEIDHNDFLSGFMFALVLFAIPYIIGVVDIVVR